MSYSYMVHHYNLFKLSNAYNANNDLESITKNENKKIVIFKWNSYSNSSKDNYHAKLLIKTRKLLTIFEQENSAPSSEHRQIGYFVYYSLEYFEQLIIINVRDLLNNLLHESLQTTSVW